MKCFCTCYPILMLVLLAMLAARCLPAPKPIGRLDSFLKELSTVLDDSVERNFLASDADSLYFVYNTVYEKVEGLMPLIDPDSELHAHLDTIGVRDVQVYWLVISYYLYGNGERIDNNIIKRIYLDMIWVKGNYEYNKEIRDKIKNARLNDSYFAVGDTVHASMYISPESRSNPFVYMKGSMQYFKSTTRSKLARFSGIILEKGFADISASDLDSTAFYYRLQLLTWDQDIISTTLDELGPGDTIDVFVVAYGRLFDNYPDRLIP